MILTCPDCRVGLDGLSCPQCGRRFPTVGEVPILLPTDSVFSEAQIATGGFYPRRRSEARTRWRRRLPGLVRDFSTVPIESAIIAATGKGLVIGAGERRSAFQASAATWTVTDVSLVFGVDYVADGTSLPFEAGAFDIVVAEHVLEHTFDMGLVARELERVCKIGGTVVILVPFSFPLHGAPYDFFRCSPVGLRVLFRRTEVTALVCGHGGFGTAAYFLSQALTSSVPRQARGYLHGVARFPLSLLRRLDRRPNLQTAGTVGLIGKRVARELSPRELVDEAAQWLSV